MMMTIDEDREVAHAQTCELDPPHAADACPDRDVPTSEELAVELARVACSNEYGPVVENVSVERGHERGPDGLCRTCGRISSRGPKFDRDEWIANGLRGVCFEEAAYVVTLAYRDEKSGSVWHATYGVPTEGPADCWAS